MGLMFVGNGNPVWFSWKFIWCILSVFHRKAYFSFLPSSVPKPNTPALSKLHDERYLSSSFFSSWTQLLCWKIFMWDEIVNSGLHRCSLLKVNIWIETCSWLYIFFPEDKQLLPPWLWITVLSWRSYLGHTFCFALAGDALSLPTRTEASMDFKERAFKCD